jgi:hypothetical protein
VLVPRVADSDHRWLHLAAKSNGRVDYGVRTATKGRLAAALHSDLA